MILYTSFVEGHEGGIIVGATAKITLNLCLKDKSEALEVLNKTINDECENVNLLGITEEERECDSLTVKEITVEEDGVQIEVYKTKEINYQLIKISKENVKKTDYVVIDSTVYVIYSINDEFNLYSNELSLLYFKTHLKSIQEIFPILEEKNVEYEIYSVR